MNLKTFCVAPWIQLDVTPTGHLQPCCVWKTKKDDRKYHFTEFEEWVNSNTMKTVRQNLHDGVAIPECHNCTVLDNVGTASLRQRYNEKAKEYYSHAALDTENWTTSAEDMVVLDLKLGNLCDLKCVMCTGESSSQILTEYKLHKEKFDSISGYYSPDIKSNFSWPLSKEFKQFINRFEHNLKSIKFTGGEPTVVPYVVEFLESIEHPENLVDLVLVTNANSYNKRMFDVLTRFKMVNVTISLEGVDQLNEMIRFNSSWKQINENIMRYKAMSNVFISINHVLQAFSVKTLVPLLHWCESMQLRLGLTVLDGPHYLRLNSVLPPVIEQFKLDLIEAKSTVVLNQHIIDSTLKLINNTYQFDVHNLTTRKKYTILLDDLRKTKLSSII